MDFASQAGKLPAARAEGSQESRVLQTHPTALQAPCTPRRALTHSGFHRTAVRTPFFMNMWRRKPGGDGTAVCMEVTGGFANLPPPWQSSSSSLLPLPKAPVLIVSSSMGRSCMQDIWFCRTPWPYSVRMKSQPAAVPPKTVGFINPAPDPARGSGGVRTPQKGGYSLLQS